MKIKRRKSQVISIGRIRIGGDNPIAIQAMTKTRTADIEKTLKQLKDLEGAGCEIARLAVKDRSDAIALKKIKDKAGISLVADIHFDWRLALTAIESGVDKIRLNPGNIYKKDQVIAVARAARLAGIPIRIGLNSGSLPKAGAKEGVATLMCRAALDYSRIIEKAGLHDIVISLKASNIADTLEAYRKIAGLCDYPLHLGLTATGLALEGAVKSSITIGALLLEGIGDTIRVSLTANPKEEVRVAKSILEALGLRNFAIQVISCPTCGRSEVNLVKIVEDLGERISSGSFKHGPFALKVAIMGCLVNGPGEAREADIGVAFGRKEGLLFKKGKPIKKVSFSNCASTLLAELKKIDR
ncbi:MAG: flavodoxin-dependent (E)-4-hydroxy-3-methylbut-2-enyl-diphosphate synthase [Candidatus Omnitrophica bacterium]|nr:flavodoxin-dependent (E)-4-hydroxy-3-methylbut-2-enyl-diphosphate synthase [Candidatus Omnitrophota bacterium]